MLSSVLKRTSYSRQLHLLRKHFRSAYRRVRRVHSQQHTNNQGNREVAGVSGGEVGGDGEEDEEVRHEERGRRREETITTQHKHYQK